MFQLFVVNVECKRKHAPKKSTAHTHTCGPIHQNRTIRLSKTTYDHKNEWDNAIEHCLIWIEPQNQFAQRSHNQNNWIRKKKHTRADRQNVFISIVRFMSSVLLCVSVCAFPLALQMGAHKIIDLTKSCRASNKIRQTVYTRALVRPSFFFWLSENLWASPQRCIQLT